MRVPALLALLALGGCHQATPTASARPLDSLLPYPQLPSSYRGYFASRLADVNEPALRATLREGGAAYRFLWIPTFDPVVSVRIERHAEAIRLIVSQSRGLGGYERKGLEWTRVSYLPAESWIQLETLVDEAGFWHPKQVDIRDGIDGSHWILEGARGGDSSQVETHWAILESQAGFLRVCEYLFTLAGFSVADLY